METKIVDKPRGMGYTTLSSITEDGGNIEEDEVQGVVWKMWRAGGGKEE